MTLKDIYDIYNTKLLDVKSEYKWAIENYLVEKGLSEDVYNRSGKRGRLLVESTCGEYVIEFYIYVKSGELSKLPSDYIWIWSPTELDNFRRAADCLIGEPWSWDLGKEGYDDGKSIPV